MVFLQCVAVPLHLALRLHTTLLALATKVLELTCMERPKNVSARRRWQWVQTLLNHWSSRCWRGGWVAVPVQDWMICFLLLPQAHSFNGWVGPVRLWNLALLHPNVLTRHNAQALSWCSVRVRMLKLSGSVMYPWCRAQANSLFPIYAESSKHEFILPSAKLTVRCCLFSNDLGPTSADWFLITWLTARLRQRLMMNCRRWKKWSRKLFTMKL